MVSERSVKVRIKGDISDFNRAMLGGAATAKSFGNDVDSVSGRLGLLTKAAFAVGPALVPIGATVVPAIAALTAGLGAATAAAGVSVLAFQGIGDALGAVNDYALDPTNSNLDKMNEALATLGPAGREFVQYLHELGPQVQQLQDVAQAGLFPGVEDGIDSLLDLFPQLEQIVGNVADSLGTLASEAGESLSGAEWSDFFDYVQTSAGPIIEQFGHILGNLAQGFAGMLVAFDPLADSFTEGMVRVSREFAKFGQNLGASSSFQEFIAYLRTSGPQAADALGALGSAFVDILVAAAPVGSVVLPIIEGLADALAAFARSPFGPAILGAAAALSALSLAFKGVTTAFAAASGSLLLTPLGGFIALAGAVAALTFGTRDWESSLKSAEAALSSNNISLKEQRNVLEANRKKVRDLKEAQGGLFGPVGPEVDAATIRLKVLEEQYGKNERKAQDAKFAQAGFGSALDGASQSVRDQTAALLDNIASHNQLADQLLKEQGGEIAFEQAIDDAAAAARKGKHSLDINTQAGRDNQKQLLTLAQSWNDLTPAQQRAAGGADRARAAFIRTARQMGATKAEAESLADRYLDIPSNVSTSVYLRDHASDPLRHIKSYIDSLHDKTITIETIYKRTIRGGTGNPGVFGLNKADGGYIRGPGGPRDDVIPAWLSDGEFVVNAAATSRNLGLLHQLNAEKFAAGGSVRPQPLGPAPVARGGDGGSQTLTATLGGPIDLTDASLQRLASMILDGSRSVADGRIAANTLAEQTGLAYR